MNGSRFLPFDFQLSSWKEWAQFAQKVRINSRLIWLSNESIKKSQLSKSKQIFKLISFCNSIALILRIFIEKNGQIHPKFAILQSWMNWINSGSQFSRIESIVWIGSTWKWQFTNCAFSYLMIHIQMYIFGNFLFELLNRIMKSMASV